MECRVDRARDHAIMATRMTTRMTTRMGTRMTLGDKNHIFEAIKYAYVVS